MTGFNLLEVPLPGPLRLPATAERLLPNGLRVTAARRHGTPLAELCLSIPFAYADAAAAALLAGAIISDPDLLERVRLLGATLAASADADLLRIAGSVPAEQIRAFLALVAEVILEPRYPAAEFQAVVDSSVQTTAALLANPAHRVIEALNWRMFANHPYGLPAPRADVLRAISRQTIVSLHHDRVRPPGSSLVIAGALDPEEMLDDVEHLLGAWSGGPAGPELGPPPESEPGSQVVDEAGLPQSFFRATMPVPPRGSDAYPPLAMAAMVFGGYFSSRLVQNLRENKGFSYSPRSSLLHVRRANLAMISVDVMTPNTAGAAREITAELVALKSRPITDAELDRARRFALGKLRLRMATLTGLVGVLCDLDLQGLHLDWLRDHDARLSAVTPDQAAEAGSRFLAPEKAVSVWLCDHAKAFPEDVTA